MRAVQKILSVLASDSMKIVLLYTSSGVVVFRWQLFKGTYYTVLFGFCKCGMKSQPGARGKTRHVGGRDRGGTIPPHKRGRPVGCRRIPPGGGGGGGGYDGFVECVGDEPRRIMVRPRVSHMQTSKGR